jgi:hypothetical protein
MLLYFFPVVNEYTLPRSREFVALKYTEGLTIERKLKFHASLLSDYRRGATRSCMVVFYRLPVDLVIFQVIDAFLTVLFVVELIRSNIGYGKGLTLGVFPVDVEVSIFLRIRLSLPGKWRL